MQGFFSGSEIALVHADRMKLQYLASKGQRGAQRIIKLFHKPEVLLGTTLVGTNLSLVILTTLGTILMIRFFGENGDLIAILVYTPLFLILGEVVPKSIYQQKADTLGPIVIYPLQFFSWLFYPVVFIFSWVARKVASLAGVEIMHRELFTTREQIATVVEMAEQGTDIDVFDRDRIMRVMRYADTTVGQVMIPIAEMTMIKSNNTSQAAIQLARKQGHFRIPVYQGKQSNIIGVIGFTMWQLMDPNLTQRTLAELTQDCYFVTPHQLLDELLPVLQQRADHMAIIVDEFGAAIGMITLEDILGEVVGEVINVGYTFEGHLVRHKYNITEIEEGNIYEMDGRVPIIEVNTRLGITLPSKEAHTIGGMIIAHLRHIPQQGEVVTEEGYSFIVSEATDRGIQKIRVERA
jgi:CBS domain containing-hemolysin-like protein